MVASASFISSKISGSSIVAGTLNSSPSAILHTVERKIFPDRVFGKRFIISACLKNATGQAYL